MAKNFYQPTRMCISCRERGVQSSFLRLKCVDGMLSSFDSQGRSFYLCISCLNDDKKLSKVLMRQCKSSEKDKLMSKLKEIITDDRKS